MIPETDDPRSQGVCCFIPFSCIQKNRHLKADYFGSVTYL
jgi:hypothetical protein